MTVVVAVKMVMVSVGLEVGGAQGGAQGEACPGNRYGLFGRVLLHRVHAGPGNRCTS